MNISPHLRCLYIVGLRPHRGYGLIEPSSDLDARSSWFWDATLPYKSLNVQFVYYLRANEYLYWLDSTPMEMYPSSSSQTLGWYSWTAWPQWPAYYAWNYHEFGNIAISPHKGDIIPTKWIYILSCFAEELLPSSRDAVAVTNRPLIVITW